MAQVKTKSGANATQKDLVHPREKDAAVSILRTANYLRRFWSPVFDQYGITSQQFNVLRQAGGQLTRATLG